MISIGIDKQYSAPICCNSVVPWQRSFDFGPNLPGSGPDLSGIGRMCGYCCQVWRNFHRRRPLSAEFGNGVARIRAISAGLARLMRASPCIPKSCRSRVPGRLSTNIAHGATQRARPDPTNRQSPMKIRTQSPAARTIGARARDALGPGTDHPISQRVPKAVRCKGAPLSLGEILCLAAPPGKPYLCTCEAGGLGAHALLL